MSAINLTRDGAVDRKPVDVAVLLTRWSVDTHTFVGASREFSLSLKDVTVMTGLPMFGNVQTVDLLDEDGTSLVKELQASLSRSKYATNKATYLSMVKYFFEGIGRKSPHQVDALLAY